MGFGHEDSTESLWQDVWFSKSSPGSSWSYYEHLVNGLSSVLGTQEVPASQRRNHHKTRTTRCPRSGD
jgi:hypothetical protein